MMLLHGCLFFRLYKTLYLSSQVKCSRTRVRAIGTDLLVDISIHASGTNKALPKVTISSVTLQKKMRAEHMQYHSIAAEWTDFVSMPNCQGHWELCEKGVSKVVTQQMLLPSVDYLWCGEISAAEAIALKSEPHLAFCGKLETSVQNMRNWNSLEQHHAFWSAKCPVLAVIIILHAPLLPAHKTVANAEFSGFISASAYIKHFNTVDFWSELLKISLQNFGCCCCFENSLSDVNKGDSEKLLSSYRMTDM